MSVFKMISSGSKELSSLEKAHKYITDLQKTSKELIGTRGCSAGMWVKSSVSLKQHYHKENKKMYRHAVLGFDDTDRITPKDARFIADEVAKRCFSRTYTEYAVHTNTQHIHAHFIICNTDYITGNQLSLSKGDLERIKNEITNVLKANGCCGVRMCSALSSLPDGTDGYYLEIEEEMTQGIQGIFTSDSGRRVVTINMKGFNFTKPQRCYGDEVQCPDFVPAQVNSIYRNDVIRVQLSQPQPNHIYQITPYSNMGEGQAMYFYDRREAESYADDCHQMGYRTHYYVINVGQLQSPFGSDEDFLI